MPYEHMPNNSKSISNSVMYEKKESKAEQWCLFWVIKCGSVYENKLLSYHIITRRKITK